MARPAHDGDAGDHRPAAADHRRGARLWAWAAAAAWRWPATSGSAMRRRRWASRRRGCRIVYSALDCEPAAARCRPGERQAGALLRPRTSRWRDCRAMGLIDVVAEQGAPGQAPGAGAGTCHPRATVAARRQAGAGGARPRRGRRARRRDRRGAEAAVNSEDYREARLAFLEKRVPTFKGR